MTTEIDFDARYSVDGYDGIAFWLKGYHEEWGEVVDDWDDPEVIIDRDHVVAVMVGDDRKHIIAVEDLTKLDEDDYCHLCGQIGCTHDGR